MNTESTLIRVTRKTTTTVLAAGLAAGLGLVALAFGISFLHAEDRGLTAHEWGTFTSVQGAEGVLLEWRPLESSKLPGFVYDLQKPGDTRITRSTGVLLGKGSMVTRQRMETPVVYFYSENERKVDVEVRFPQGSITEWYPQASEVGILPPPGVFMTPGGLTGTAAMPAPKESRIHWSNIAVLPTDAKNSLAAALPQDSSGSHYFAARETDAAYVRLNSPAQTEKFLFYRGAGNFPTPLRVTMQANDAFTAANVETDVSTAANLGTMDFGCWCSSCGENDAVTVANLGTEPLRHMFLIQVRNNLGDFVVLDPLLPGKEARTSLQSHAGPVPIAEFPGRLAPKLVAALVAEGLYPREAAAMVKTWQDSWLTEPGTRILYLLPRQWTDATLPMKITPAPTELVRVMVGRAEMLTPEIEQQLLTAVTRANAGDAQALQDTGRLLRQLDRFAEPALVRALGKLQPAPEQAMKLYALLRSAPEALP